MATSQAGLATSASSEMDPSIGSRVDAVVSVPDRHDRVGGLDDLDRGGEGDAGLPQAHEERTPAPRRSAAPRRPRGRRGSEPLPARDIAKVRNRRGRRKGADEISEVVAIRHEQRRPRGRELDVEARHRAEELLAHKGKADRKTRRASASVRLTNTLLR